MARSGNQNDNVSESGRHVDDNAERAMPSRRTLIKGLSFAALAASAAPAFAQAPNWTDQIFGQTASISARGADERKKPDPLNDLRPNNVPYRSDAMLEAIEGAIVRYQTIVERGGWPMIPGIKMIRPEDDDDRLPVLRAHLALGPEWMALRGQKVVAFAGIGDPERFHNALQAVGARVVAFHPFGDHYGYAAADIQPMLDEAYALGAIPVTTGKDAVRIQSWPPARRGRVLCARIRAGGSPGRPA